MAGLTHSGFYRHFDSKEQLVAEANDEALAELIKRMVFDLRSPVLAWMSPDLCDARRALIR